MAMATGIDGLVKGEPVSGVMRVGELSGFEVPRRGGLDLEVRRQINAPVTYISMEYKKGERIMLTQALTMSFENAPAKVVLNNLEFDAHDMFLAHYSPMWLDLNGDAKVTYVIPGRIEAGEGAGINVMPSRIYVTPIGSEPLEAVLTSERKDAVMDVLRGKRYMLKTRSPQLVVVDGSEYWNIDNVPMTLMGAAVITPRNLVREHSAPLSLSLADAEISYK